MRSPVCASILALPLLLGVALSAGPSVAHAGEGEQDEGTLAADVKVEVRLENGKIVTHLGEVPVYEMDHTFSFDGEGHAHALTLNIKQGDAPGKLVVRLSYERDSTPIIAPYTTDFKARKREVLWAEDIAIALTFKPKRVKPKDTSRDEGEQIEPDKSEDPLGELEGGAGKKKKSKKKPK
jgi:hypothetical protein